MTRRRAALALVGGVLAAALAYSQYWVLTGRVATVEAGRLYRSAGVPADRLIEICRRHGIRTVIDFRKEPAETRVEAQALQREGIRHVHLPTGQVPNADTVAQFLRLMDERRSEPVLIHCTHGVGRTGVFSAIYRMEYQGWPNRLAIAEAVIYSGFGSFGPGSAKAKFLSAYSPRRLGQRP